MSTNAHFRLVDPRVLRRYKSAVRQMLQKTKKFETSEVEYCSRRMIEKTLIQIRGPDSDAFNFVNIPKQQIQLLDSHLLRKLVKRRVNGEPLQYILGKWRFCGLDLVVRQPILIPRPETEELVMWVVRYVKQVQQQMIMTKANSNLDTVLGDHLDYSQYGDNIDNDSDCNNNDATLSKSVKPTFLDIGTGSGAITCALMQSGLFDNQHSIAIDINEDACTLAKENIGNNKKNKLSKDLVKVKCIDFESYFSEIQSKANTDTKFSLPNIIVANLPYVPDDEVDNNLSIEVTSFEDQRALRGGKDGLLLIRKLLECVIKTTLLLMNQNMQSVTVFLETDHRHTPGMLMKMVKEILSVLDNGNKILCDTSFRKDMCDKNRFFMCQLSIVGDVARS